MKTTALICPDLALGWGTAITLTCTVSPIAQSSAPRRTWNGHAHETASAAFRQLRVTFAAGGDDMLPPALLGMWPGHRFTARLQLPFGGPVGLMAGRTVVGAFYADEDGVHHPMPEAPEEMPEGARPYHLLELELQIWEPWTVSQQDREVQVGWQLVAEEYAPPFGGA